MSDKATPKRHRNKEAKGWFLTYPKTGELTPEALLEALRARLTIVEYLIAQEEHKDGTNHLHAFLKLEKKRQWKVDYFDVTLDRLYHGNYQIAKSWKAVQAYVTKGGRYITNIDVESAKQKKGKHNLELAAMNPVDAVASGEICFMDLQKFVKNKQLWNELTLARTPSEDEKVDKKRHMWIYGPSNSGKTTKLRSFIELHGEDKFFQIPRNNDFTGYFKQQWLWIDEFKGCIPANELNALCDGNTKVNTKGGSAKIRLNPVLLVLSNHSISECYNKVDPAIIQSLRNRFHEQLMDHIYE